MTDELVETKRKAEIVVGEPIMQGFMRSLIAEPDLSSVDQSWELEDAFRRQVTIPLNKFVKWIKRVAPEFSATQGLTNEQLGKVKLSGRKSSFVEVTHEATQMIGRGNDKAEAQARLRDCLEMQLQRWQSEGDLFGQATSFEKRLLNEYRKQFGLTATSHHWLSGKKSER